MTKHTFRPHCSHYVLLHPPTAAHFSSYFYTANWLVNPYYVVGFNTVEANCFPRCCNLHLKTDVPTIAAFDFPVLCYCACVRAQFSVLHQRQPKLQFALHVFFSAALKYSVALCQQKCKRHGTLESNYCSSNFGKFFVGFQSGARRLEVQGGGTFISMKLLTQRIRRKRF